MRNYSHVLAAVYGQPWAVQPEMLLTIDRLIRMRVAGVTLAEEEVDARLQAAQDSAGARIGRQDSNSVAVLPVYGLITQRQNLMTRTSGGTSLDDLRGAMAEAMADPQVSAIVLDVDSPGGSVNGLAEFAAQMRAMRGQGKPIVAVANPLMASAAYYIASQADQVVSTQSGTVGSIGTVALHQEHSVADAQEGVKSTLIASDPRKILGNEFEPLTTDALAQIQGRVDHFARQFVNDVAAGRSRGDTQVTAQEVLDGYGGGLDFVAPEAKRRGLVDRIATLDTVVNDLGKAMAPPKRPGLRAEGTSLILSDLASLGTPELSDGPVGVHHTPTDNGPWDGAAQEANLPAADAEGSYRKAYAWYDGAAPDPNGDGFPDRKSDYKFIHHEVGAGGSVGAANSTGCSAGIAVLNGGRGGSTIPMADHQGVHAHLAAHLSDAGRAAPPLHGEAPDVPVADAPLSPAAPVVRRIAATQRPAASRTAWAANLKEHARGTAGPGHLPVGGRTRRLPGPAQRSRS